MSRIIVKVGTKALSDSKGQLDTAVIARIVRQLVELKRARHEVVLVSSGAVGAGKAVFHLPGTSVPEKQVYAAIGQARLVSLYSALLEKDKLLCAQVLTTKADLADPTHYANIKNCLEHLLHDDILPIVNENDVVVVEELRLTENDERTSFTDNDELAASLATMMGAEVVILITSVDGILDGDGKLMPKIAVTAGGDHPEMITKEVSAHGRGGMHTKFTMAKELALQGKRVHIVNVTSSKTLLEVVDGAPVGTVVVVAAKPA